MGTVPRDHKSFGWEFDQVLQRLDDFAAGVVREQMIPEAAARHHRETAQQAAALMREVRDVGASRGFMYIVEQARAESAASLHAELGDIAEALRENRHPVIPEALCDQLADLAERAARALARGMP